jgi:RHS repeat-associated protein
VSVISGTNIIRPTYDNNGNTLTDAQGRSFTWDFENRLVQAMVSGQNGGTTTFKYDPFGRRIQKSGPLGTTNYLYDGPGIVEEMDNTSSQVAAYVQGIGVDQPLSEFRSGSASYYEADGLGSITTLTNVSGTTAATYVYDSFGSLSASTGSVTNPFRYTSREFDAEIGLSFYRARYYGSSIGRFANEDPLGLAGDGTNFYIYVNNSPIVFIDPSGLAHCAAGADCNFTPEMRDALACFDRCTHRDNEVTSGRRPGGGQHGNGQACDLNRANNRDLERPVVERCVMQCFAHGYGQEEHNSPTYHPVDPADPSTHYHLQINTVPGTQPGFGNGIRPYQPSPPRR